MFDRINNIITSTLKQELAYRFLRLHKNEKALFLKFTEPQWVKVRKMVDLMIKKLPPNTGVFFDENIQVIIAPLDTIEHQMGFAEAKACVIGAKYLKHQEQTLVLATQWKAMMSEFAALKRQQAEYEKEKEPA